MVDEDREAARLRVLLDRRLFHVSAVCRLLLFCALTRGLCSGVGDGGGEVARGGRLGMFRVEERELVWRMKALDVVLRGIR